MKKRVAVILTGELRYLDYCYQWWKESAKSNHYEVSFFTSVWPHYENAAMTDEFAELFEETYKSRTHIAATITHLFPDVKSVVLTPETILNAIEYPHELKRRGDEQLLYFFGRTAQLTFALKVWKDTLQDYDIIVHSRWDTAMPGEGSRFFPGSSLEALCEATTYADCFAFRGMCVDLGMVYSCDFAYAAPVSDFYDVYGTDIKKTIEEHVDIWKELYDNNDDNKTFADTFLIGHNIYSTFIARKFKSIQISNHDATLVRKHDFPFKYNYKQWQKLNALFLSTTTGTDLKSRFGKIT